MYGGSIENFFVHRNIFVALHHKIFPDGNRNVSPGPLTKSPEISTYASQGLWTFGPRAFINKALTEMPLRRVAQRMPPENYSFLDVAVLDAVRQRLPPETP
ncbi:hypothetical protein ACVOMV_19245 [Mesorhizobium atlanticum]